MATHSLRGDYTDFFGDAVDFDYSSSGDASETTMEKGGDDLEGEIVGCEFELAGDRFGHR